MIDGLYEAIDMIRRYRSVIKDAEFVITLLETRLGKEMDRMADACSDVVVEPGEIIGREIS